MKSSRNEPIWFVCKDQGGTNGILPVYEECVRQGVQSLLIADGKAIELLGNQASGTLQLVDKAIHQRKFPAALVTSMCSGGGLGCDLAQVLRGRCPTIALQDFWGSILWREWSRLSCRPDYIVVNDPVGKAIVQDAWREFPTDRIKVLGYPALDKYAQTDKKAVKLSVKKKLGITDDLPIVLYASQLTGSAETLREVCEALNSLEWDNQTKVHLIPRLHPRMRNNAPQEFAALNQALQAFGHGYAWPFTEICETAELVQAADVVVGEWTTVLVDAATVRSIPIAVLYPNGGMARFLNSNDGNIKEFPLVKLGCAAKAQNQGELSALLHQALAGELSKRLSKNQDKCLMIDGLNALRVANFIQSLL